MPILAAFIGSLFTSLVSFLAQFVTKRIAIFAAVVLALGAAMGSFVAAVKALVVGISMSAPVWLVQGWNWFVPNNFDECLAIVLAAKSLAWVYSWNLKIISEKLKI